MINTKVLANTMLFKGFSVTQIKKIADDRNSVFICYSKGQIIHHEFERCTSLDLVVSGKLNVQKIDEDGNILTMATFISQDIIGANVLFASNNYYPMTVTAESESSVLHLPKQSILSLCKQSDAFIESLLTIISNRATALTRRIDELVNKTIRERLTQYFLFEGFAQQSNTFRLSLSKKALAEKFGVQRSSLSRELSKMRLDGLIEFENREITLKGAFLKETNIE